MIVFWNIEIVKYLPISFLNNLKLKREKMNEETFVATNVADIAKDRKKRQTAIKLRINDLYDHHISNGIIELDGKKITRINIIANVIDKFVSESESKFVSLTLDDASSQIRVKAFGDDVNRIYDMDVGDTILLIGNTRFYNDELYINPEVAKQVSIEWLLVRKLELEKLPHFKIKSNKIVEEKIEKNSESVREKIKFMLQKTEEGVDIDKIILELKQPIEEINSAVSDMLEEAEIYEPKPGRIRLL